MAAFKHTLLCTAITVPCIPVVYMQTGASTQGNQHLKPQIKAYYNGK